MGGTVPALPYQVLGIMDALILSNATFSREVCRRVRVAVFTHQNGAAIPGHLGGDDG